MTVDDTGETARAIIHTLWQRYEWHWIPLDFVRHISQRSCLHTNCDGNYRTRKHRYTNSLYLMAENGIFRFSNHSLEFSETKNSGR